jgi:hypothetical protein
LAYELVDELFPVTKVSTLDEVLEFAGTETASRVGELERPEEVGSLLEVGADSVDFVDEVLNADNAKLAQLLLDYVVVRDRKALLVDLSVSTLVDELANGLKVGVSVSDERLDNLKHLQGSLGQLDKASVVDLKEAEEL